MYIDPLYNLISQHDFWLIAIFLVGLMFLFLGYRFYRLTFFLTGLFVFLPYGLEMESFTVVFLSIAIAISFALVPVVGLLASGYGLGLYIFSLIEGLAGQGLSYFWMFLLIAFNLIVSVFRPKGTIIFYSSLAGAMHIVTCVLLFLSRNDEFTARLETLPSPFLQSVTIIVLTIVGIRFQILNTYYLGLDRYGLLPRILVTPEYYDAEDYYSHDYDDRFYDDDSSDEIEIVLTAAPVDTLPYNPALIGKTCPYCQTPIKPGSNIYVCSECEIPHHAECWDANGRCTTYGCHGQPMRVIDHSGSNSDSL